MKYVPPFETVKGLFQISSVKGELRVSATYDDFVAVIKLLLAGVHVDEEWYLSRYPDVAQAIEDGEFNSAKHHFVENGYFEARFPCEPMVDEAWYLIPGLADQNPCAQSRRPMDMTVQGCATSLFQAWQQ
jgi:hypothetical protein